MLKNFLGSEKLLEIWTYDLWFIANAQTDCAMLLGNNFGSEQLYKVFLIVLFI